MAAFVQTFALKRSFALALHLILVIFSLPFFELLGNDGPPAVNPYRLLKSKWKTYPANTLFRRVVVDNSQTTGQQIFIEAIKQKTGKPDGRHPIDLQFWEQNFLANVDYDQVSGEVRFKKLNGTEVVCRPHAVALQSQVGQLEAAKTEILEKAESSSGTSAPLLGPRFTNHPANPNKIKNVQNLEAALEWMKRRLEEIYREDPDLKLKVEFGKEGKNFSKRLNYVPRQRHRDKQKLFAKDQAAYKLMYGSHRPKYARTFSNEEIANGQSLVIHRLLKSMQSDPLFTNAQLASQFLSALTLSTEFGLKQSDAAKENDRNHRTLAHLFWAYRTAKNRAEIYSRAGPEMKARIKDRLQIDPTYTFQPEGGLENFLLGTAAGAMWSSREFSGMNVGESSVSEVLTLSGALADPKMFTDIFDLIAADDAGLIQMANDRAPPFLTHYLSPVAAKGIEPLYWKDPSLFVGYRLAINFPRLHRLDFEDWDRLISATKGDEGLINPDHFIGGMEYLWKNYAP